MKLSFEKKPLIMGILNVTPDSFSGDGLLTGDNYIEAAFELGSSMVQDGADWLDIGGESSRPGHTFVDAEEEMRRVVPVIRKLRDAFPSLPLAVDTVKAVVADAAITNGATIINDISALRHDPAMADAVVRSKAFAVLMHNRSDSATVVKDQKIGGEYTAPAYGDIVEDVMQELAARAAFAQSAGIARDKIILDPGIGFGKTVEQNMALIRHTDRLTALGYPVLIGASRKSFIGRVLDLPVDERLEGTAALTAIAAFQGADIVRVHDVRFMARVAKMAGSVTKT